MAYLKEGYFDAALTDATLSSTALEPSEKALYRGAQSLYHLRRYCECEDMLMALCTNFPSNLEAQKELSRVRRQTEEQKTGVYDFRRLYMEATVSQPPHLDCATFIGPVVVNDSPGRGRGLFTTKPLKAGDLILCEKPFAHCYAGPFEENRESSSRLTVLINTQTNRISQGTQADLITTIVQKLWQNPSLQKKIGELYHGFYTPLIATAVDGNPIIDTYSRQVANL